MVTTPLVLLAADESTSPSRRKSNWRFVSRDSLGGAADGVTAGTLVLVVFVVFVKFENLSEGAVDGASDGAPGVVVVTTPSDGAVDGLRDGVPGDVALTNVGAADDGGVLGVIAPFAEELLFPDNATPHPTPIAAAAIRTTTTTMMVVRLLLQPPSAEGSASVPMVASTCCALKQCDVVMVYSDSAQGHLVTGYEFKEIGTLDYRLFRRGRTSPGSFGERSGWRVVTPHHDG